MKYYFKNLIFMALKVLPTTGSKTIKESENNM